MSEVVPLPTGLPPWVDMLHRQSERTYSLLDQPMLRRDTLPGILPCAKGGTLVAAGETGKTTHVIVRAICIATGRPFFGIEGGLQGTWGLLSFDDTRDDLDAALAFIVQRMHRDGVLTDSDLKLIERHVVLRSLKNSEGIACPTFNVMLDGRAHATQLACELIEYLDGLPKPLRGFTLDTYRHFAGASANDDMAAINTVAGINEVAETLECTGECTAHTGKQNFRDGVKDLYSATGSAVLGDNSRFVNVLQRATWPDVRERMDMTSKQRGQAMALTPARGSIISRRGDPLFYWRDGWRFGAIEGTLKSQERRQDDRDRDILQAIRKGAVSKNAIYHQVGGKREAVLDRVDDLMERGHIGTQTGSQKLTLTTTGTRLLNSEP